MIEAEPTYSNKTYIMAFSFSLTSYSRFQAANVGWEERPGVDMACDAALSYCWSMSYWQDKVGRDGKIGIQKCVFRGLDKWCVKVYYLWPIDNRVGVSSEVPVPYVYIAILLRKRITKKNVLTSAWHTCSMQFCRANESGRFFFDIVLWQLNSHAEDKKMILVFCRGPKKP